jgi:hypothetical protein
MAPTLLCMSCMSRINTEIRLCTTVVVVVAAPALPVLARLFLCCDVCSSRASVADVFPRVLVIAIEVVEEVVEA